MRFNVELLLENETIPKDKNRIIISLLKHSFSSYDKDYYNRQYKEKKNKSKSFTFSLYMGSCKFMREEIIIPDKKIILNFSTYDTEAGIMFYNSFLKNKGLEYPLKNNIIKVNKINLNKEKLIVENEVVFKTLSPILARAHDGNNKNTWYYSLNEEKGRNIFIENLKYQLQDIFGESRKLDFEEIEFNLMNNREVKIKNYGIEVLGNVGTFELKAKPYILEHLYKSGIGSQRNSGFGMIDLV